MNLLLYVNNRHDFKGNFPYDDFSHKTHARPYFRYTIIQISRCKNMLEISQMCATL